MFSDREDFHKKVTVESLDSLYQKGEPITMLTAHDLPSASVADAAGIEVVLVGDSLAIVAMGMEDTNEVKIEHMLLHCRSVSRAVRSALVIADLPMGSYECSPERAVQSAIRMVKEGHVNAVKLEGGKEMSPTIRRISQMGIPVMAHVGLTPQRQHSIGGFKVQGKSITGAVKLLEDSLAVQEAGAFMILIEAIPPKVAEIVTGKLQVPTIGIGAGAECSGQVLVQVDMTGNFQPGRFTPKFVKTYADVWGKPLKGLRNTKGKNFPSQEYTYSMSKDALEGFQTYIKGKFPEE
ncbi:3-methyl-2-oxobutanoate hydroxymethyltransferase [Penicillium malachiteum]|nr:3-methyl-2-oxobutanoate hydroxymethyltransferase [Penicillium malachiteum]